MVINPIDKIKLQIMLNKIIGIKNKYIQEQLHEKTLVFSVNAGRSGSQSLQKILDISHKIKALHEPRPAFHCCAIDARRDPVFAREFWRFSKIPSILQHRQRVYVETSHLFAKGFIEPLLSLGVRPKVIFLQRSPRKIAQSLLHLGSIPGQEKEQIQRGNISFLLDPIDDKVCLPVQNWRNFSDYQKCFWYALEMLSRSKHYQRLFVEKGSPYFKCQTADLSDFRTCMKIFDFIGVDINDAEKKYIKTICAEKFNRKSSKKCFEGSPIEDIDIQEAFVMESIDPDGEISDILSLTD